MPQRNECHTAGMDIVRRMDDLPIQSAVLFVLNLEAVTGFHLLSLCRGVVLGPALPACAGITLIPILTVKPDGEWVVLYVASADILSCWPGSR